MGMLRMRYSNQQGVTLVEVLVSMFLLGIAVIGFVALQVRALSVTSESSYRSQAMSIAQDLSERMRANYGKIAKYRTANWTVLPTQDCYAVAPVCTADQMVDFDIRLAKEVASASLPSGDIVAKQCGGSSNICIYVSWGTTTTASNGTANACTTASGTYANGSPECVMLEVYNET